jgi:hypothetical protein
VYSIDGNILCQSPWSPDSDNSNLQRYMSSSTQDYICECGGDVVVKTSRSQKNPDRDFLSCALCNSFCWCDEWNGKPLIRRGAKRAREEMPNVYSSYTPYQSNNAPSPNNPTRLVLRNFELMNEVKGLVKILMQKVSRLEDTLLSDAENEFK